MKRDKSRRLPFHRVAEGNPWISRQPTVCRKRCSQFFFSASVDQDKTNVSRVELGYSISFIPNATCLVDCFPVRIRGDASTFSGKYHTKVMKFQLVTTVVGRPLALQLVHECRKHDSKALRELGLGVPLADGEVAIGDKTYVGHADGEVAIGDKTYIGHANVVTPKKCYAVRAHSRREK